MRLKLLVGLLVSFSGCKGPEVVTCVSDPQNNAFQCYDPKTKETFSMSFLDTSNYVCFTPDGFQELYNYCKQK